MEKRKVKHTAVFYPCTMGVFILLIIILSITAGLIRRELVLTLTGAALLAIWAYCLVMTLLLALFHRRRAKNIYIILEPERLVCDGQTNAVFRYNNDAYAEKSIFQIPGILVRCRVLLNTMDGRRVTYDFKPENKTGLQQNFFQVKKRGAYYSAYDEFAVFDIFGFFRFAYRINSGIGNSAARLLVSPRAAAEPLFFWAKGGDANRQDTLSLERTDYLIDHRPYIPGDDPRRINWKLYGHGGELIVRQGEREPPPSSNLTILIDTQYDSLYSKKSRLGNSGLGNKVKLGNSAPEASQQAAAQLSAVDLLCENALAIINNAGKEINIQIGFTGQSKKSGSSLTKAEMGFFLAYPAALPAPRQTTRLVTTAATLPAATLLAATLPAVPEDCGIVIFALPRIETGNLALDKFLADNAGRSIELLFVYALNGNGGSGDSVDNAESARREKFAAEAQQAAAASCANFYNRRPGVRAQAVGVL